MLLCIHLLRTGQTEQRQYALRDCILAQDTRIGIHNSLLQRNDLHFKLVGEDDLFEEKQAQLDQATGASQRGDA